MQQAMNINTRAKLASDMASNVFSFVLRLPLRVFCKHFGKHICKHIVTLTLLFVLLLLSTGCAGLAKVGKEPELSPVQDPTTRTDYRRVEMPMPTPERHDRNPNSLWRSGSRAFFKDLRATRIGDIVTVLIDVQDSAELNNQTQRARSSNKETQNGALSAIDSTVQTFFPLAPSLNDLFDGASQSNTQGTGSISRDERITMRVAAVVTQTLPNGNLVVYGRQELRVNFEVRVLHVAGVLRPQDISNANTIAFDKIAEARVAYGGRGLISDLQQPRIGNQIADVLLPF